MTSRDFCFWLQGLFELAGPKALDEKQTDLVKRHLALVFVHEIDPVIEKGSPELKKLLDDLHSGQGSKEPGPPAPAPHVHSPACHHDIKFRC